MKLDNPRRLIVEDFPEEMRDVISKLAIIINKNMEDTYNLLNKRVDFDNLYQELITFTVIVNASGAPIKDTKFSTTSLANAIGGHVIYCANKSNTLAFPMNAPFVSFTNISNNLFKVNNITGLVAGQEYEIKLVVYGK